MRRSNIHTKPGARAQILSENEVIIRSQTGAKLEPNRHQIDNESTTNRHQTDNESTTNRHQTDNESTTNRHQTDNESTTNRHQTDNGTGNETGIKPATKVKSLVSPLELAGLQKIALIYLHDHCRFRGSRETSYVLIAEIADYLKTSPGAAKVSLQRLESKGYIIRKRFKVGRAGWSIYELPEDIYQAMTIAQEITKPAQNRQQTGIKPTTEPATKPASNLPSSSSSKILNTKTTTTQDFDSDAFGLSGVWREIDQTPLTDQGCPFGPSQIRQARSFGMSPEALQESIYNFGWALMQNWQPPGGFKSSPLNFFMGCLRSNGLYEHENYYRQKRERAEIEKRWLEECRRKEQEPIMPDADTFIAAAHSGLDLTEFKS